HRSARADGAKHLLLDGGRASQEGARLVRITLGRLDEVLGDAAVALRSETELSSEANPVLGPARLRFEDEICVDVLGIAEVQRTGADLRGPIGMPQRDPILAADPRPV